jgi:hypothetical protein
MNMSVEIPEKVVPYDSDRWRTPRLVDRKVNKTTVAVLDTVSFVPDRQLQLPLPLSSITTACFIVL